MDILCLSTSNYHPFPTRKQNVMNRMKDCRVVYVDPPVTYIAPLKDKAVKPRLSMYKNAPEFPMEHIRLYACPPVMPFFNKKRFINELNQKRIAKYLAKIVRDNGFGGDFRLWVYSPTAADVVAPLAKELGIPAATLWKHTVYDCVDRHSAYPGLIDPEVVDAMEEDLARSCGCVFTTAKGLYDRLSRFNPNTHLIPNGAAYELFSKVQEMDREAAEAGTARSAEEKLKKPHFGFVGMLQECIDYDILKSISKRWPEGKLTLIGRSLPGVDLGWIKECPNVEYVGLVPQTELPQRIKDFDVCLNVFLDNDLSKDVSPLKFYEYLATGKPVVSTPVPYQVRDYADCIYIAEGREDFADRCLEALSEQLESPKRARRTEEALACSWDERVRSMREILGW